MVFPSMTPQRGWFWPSMYIRPNYFFVITPFGTQHIDYPPIIFIPACIVTCVLLLCTTCWFCCRSKKTVRRILVVLDAVENLDHLLGLHILSILAKKGKVQVVGIVTCGKDPTTGAALVTEWIESCRFFTDIEFETPAVVHGVEGNDAVLNSVQKYGRNLTVLLAGPATVVCEALRRDEKHILRTLGSMVVQGFARTKKKEGRRNKCCCRQYHNIVIPDFSRSKHLREDKHSANHIFSWLQNDVPFSVLDQPGEKSTSPPVLPPFQEDDFCTLVTSLCSSSSSGLSLLCRMACMDSNDASEVANKLLDVGIDFNFLILVWYVVLVGEGRRLTSSMVDWGRHQILRTGEQEDSVNVNYQINKDIVTFMKSSGP